MSFIPSQSRLNLNDTFSFLLPAGNPTNLDELSLWTHQMNVLRNIARDRIIDEEPGLLAVRWNSRIGIALIDPRRSWNFD